MLKKVFRLIARLAILGSLVYLVRAALRRWIDGPEPAPAPPGRQWAPVTEAPRVAPPAEPQAAPQAAPSKAAGPGGTWVAPDDSGAAPNTHPVKVKLSSGLYREPGSSNYERTRPDRCYVSAEAAEADGFTRARR